MSSGLKPGLEAPSDRKKSPQLRTPNTDSDGSGDTNSLSQESNLEARVVPQGGGGAAKKRGGPLDSEWEIVEGLKDGQRYDKKPDVFSGYLHKKRKWPLKGWHKRYFVVDKGILVYGKNMVEVNRGKIHGSLDIGLSVISTKSKRKRLDIDAEEFIYHLKAKQSEVFTEWVDQLKRHRLYRQHVLTYGASESRAVGRVTSGSVTKASPAAPASPPPPLRPWPDPSPTLLPSLSTELSHARHALDQLARILHSIETSSAHDNETSGNANETGYSPNVKKDRKKFGLRKKKSSKGSSVDLSASPALSNKTNDLDTTSYLGSSGGVTTPSPSRPQSLPPPELLSLSHSDNQLASDFTILAKDIYGSLKSVLYSLVTERDRLKIYVQEGESTLGNTVGGSGAVVATLRATLHHALQQNSELRSRLKAIHAQSDPTDLPHLTKTLESSLSYSSSCVSGSEFYDAEDGGGGVGPSAGGSVDAEAPERLSDTSSVAGSVTSEEASLSSEASDLADSEYNPQHTLCGGGGGGNLTGRRSKLPSPRPKMEGLSLWNLLTKNIGKDLSQVSMPVGLNEPLNMLQRLCEELEYSELLDKASELSDPYERMLYVAAFAVSSYGSSFFRAGSKPFNPLLGETYECIREDKGFRFIAEQVSHHPPVSVCFAESRNFVFWQDARIKTKFWGKSMEFQPTGFVNVKLERPNGEGADLYRWNKVTTCVHNLFSAQRWVDQYGELTITSENITCNLTFVKASYWSAKRHEIQGSIVDDKEGKVVRTLFGRWSEALYCGVAPSAKVVWRPGTMPQDYELYYGFTRFAMELNELDPEQAKCLPVTDTRFRPDQRLLEEGKLEEAEETKLRLELCQRERRKRLESQGTSHTPRWFRKTKDSDSWEYEHKYWELRKSPGFINLNIEPLW